jgi:hypothetical protein
VCSNEITPRILDSINAPFPSVLEYQIPAFLADKSYTDPATKKPFLDIPVSQTVYALWIGTNDLGNGAFITNSQVKGKTLNDYVGCLFGVLEKLYKSGARNFVLMNVVPLYLTPQYASPDDGGVTADKFWKDKPADRRGINRKMEQQVNFVNSAMERRLSTMARRYPGSQFALLNTHELVCLP